VLYFTRIDKFIDVLEGFDQAGATFFFKGHVRAIIKSACPHTQTNVCHLIDSTGCVFSPQSASHARCKLKGRLPNGCARAPCCGRLIRRGKTTHSRTMLNL